MKKVSELISQLTVVDENIRAEAIRQPQLFIEAVRYRVRKMRVRAQAEAELEAFDAQLSITLRAKAIRRGDKGTEGYFKARLQKHSKHRSLQAAVNAAEANEEFSKLLIEAYRMRRDAVKILADAQGYEAMREGVDIERSVVHRRLVREARILQTKRQRNED
jgi:hypothetical protein